MTKALFINEADLCSQFVANLPEGWTVYPETAGWDLLLVRDADGAQLGIEAKMKLNAKVILQALDSNGVYSEGKGPDFRAVLVPYGTAGADLASIARRFGLCVMTMHTEASFDAANPWRGYSRHPIAVNRLFDPALPGDKTLGGWDRTWVDHMTVAREVLPEYVPDHGGGRSAPLQLSEWKIQAIKISILLERNGFVTWRDFKHLRLDKRRWLVMGWLQQSPEAGKYVLGPRPIGLRLQHPVNFEQIAADYEKWKPTDEGLPL